MNCSCSADRCPHVQYIRTLLETTEKDRLHPEADPLTGWKKSIPHLRKAAEYIFCAMKILFFLWVAFTKVALQLWLCVLESNRYLWLAFLAYAMALICSLPGVHGSMSTEVVSAGVKNVLTSTALIVYR